MCWLRLSDKKKGHVSGGVYDYYTADVVNATDYAPFGMEMVGRSFSAATSYKFGFNGKLNDNEVYGEGNFQDYGMRMYDPRVGRFWSVDPLTRKFPFYSPYHFAGNKPIEATDLDGLEEWMAQQGFAIKRRAELQLANNRQTQSAAEYIHAAVQADIKYRSSSSSPSFGQLDMSYSAVQGRQELESQYQQAKNLSGATMDPFAAGVAYQSLTTVKQTVQSPLRNGYTIYQGIKEGDKGKILLGTLGLAFDFSGFKGGSAAVDEAVVNEANLIFNSKEFATIESAFKSGEEASVKVGNRIINYHPETAGSSITLHPSPYHEGSGFQLGPQAFKTEGELKKTLIQELYRLNTQGTGELGVDVTKKYTQQAADAAERLYTKVKKTN